MSIANNLNYQNTSDLIATRYKINSKVSSYNAINPFESSSARSIIAFQ